jgi:hypothetical protein
VDLLHVQVDDLQAEVVLRLEVVVERALWNLRRLEHRRDAEVVVAVPQEHRHALLEKLLLGVDGHRGLISRPVGLMYSRD